MPEQGDDQKIPEAIGRALTGGGPGDVIFVDLTEGTSEPIRDDVEVLVELIDNTAAAKNRADGLRARKSVNPSIMAEAAQKQRGLEAALIEHVSKMVDKRSRALNDKPATCSWEPGQKDVCASCTKVPKEGCKSYLAWAADGEPGS